MNEKMMTRRQLLKKVLAGLGVGIASSLGLPGLFGCTETREQATPTATVEGIGKGIALLPTGLLREAMFYRSLGKNIVQCQICFRNCVVEEGKVGFCRTRKNIGGKYYSLVYGHPAALQIDPIEKEPSFHMLPGGRIFCTGTAGCNQRCKFCHNWHISQRAPWEVITYNASPEEVVTAALAWGCNAVSFTYNDPLVFYEFMFDIAKLAKEKGLKVLCHTNGTLSAEPLFALLEILDAITIDLKAFTPEFYRQVSFSRLEPVLLTLENIRKTDTHLEIVNLVIPTLNDNMEDIRRMCVWIREKLGDETPLHFTRFSPAYKLTKLPPTPIKTLEEAAKIADDEGLKYVYIGNVPGHKRNSTFCPQCGKRVIHRVHFSVVSMKVRGGKCSFCGHSIPGIWWEER
jgi:pyruvate formate lyase activating enzyme